MGTQSKKTLRTRKIEGSNHTIIGVGASAGGLEAIYKLFEAPVPSNTSFVIIQHLPPDYVSNTVHLLSEHSGKEVVAATNNLAIEPEVIYIMDERKVITIREGRLYLTTPETDTRNCVIDNFFNSLAEDQGENSVGIILSGSNSDGTEGAEAIKKAGGIVIAQDPNTTEFNRMPDSIIKAGLADMVLSPNKIMNEIDRYLEQRDLYRQFTKDNEADLITILDIVKKHTPLDFSDYKRSTLIRRITKRITFNKLESLPEYITFLKSNPEEIESLAKEFLISVTSFFRDPAAFKIIEKVIAELIQNKGEGEHLKVWSVGCATGEEAYSLAIIIDEILSANEKTDLSVKIFASDVDREALAIGSRGFYPKTIEKEVSSERLSRYFTGEHQGYRVKDHLRKMIIFAQHDITTNPPYNKMDLISCRNVLIYMNSVLQRNILSTFHFCLNPDGYLFLGPSESLGDLKDKMETIDKQWKIYKNTNPTRNLLNSTYTTLQPQHNLVRNIPSNPERASKNGSSVAESVNKILLEELNSAGVCIDRDFNIIRTMGDFKKYLLPEMFTFNLLELLPKKLSIATATSVRRVLKENHDILLENVEFEGNNGVRAVDVKIKEIPDKEAKESNLIVLFREKERVKKDSAIQETYETERITTRYLADVEAELRETREKLMEANEALAISMDNAQAYNEELIANNEELQSTNEEVQSINEELQTVNNDYQETIKKLIETNDELDNYFKSTTNSQLYVSTDLIIRKFSPMSFKQINLKESDIGRPLGDISTNIKFSTLIADIRETINSSTEMEKEVQTLDGKWYQLRVTPFTLQQNNKVDGAIITLNDISELKYTQSKLNMIIEDHNTFIYSVSHDLKNEISNIMLTSEYLETHATSGEMDAEEIVKFSGMVKESVVNLMNVITDMSDIPKIEKEILEGNFEEVNLERLLVEIEKSNKDLIYKSGSVIITDLKVPTIRFMKKNLRSIVQNLITNAIKYKDPERTPEIKIKTEDTGDYVVLSIQDNGMGIEDTKQKEIFQRYKRIQGRNTENVEGTGIGLYLINRMVISAEGRVEVESTPGVGSTFKVWFRKKQGQKLSEK